VRSAAGEPRAFALRLAAAVAERCGGALLAAYLHGSGALGGWIADRSDVDMLLVAADDIAAPAVATVGEMLVASAPTCPGRGLECSLVTASHAADPSPPWPFVLHVGSDPGNERAPRLVLGADCQGDPDLLMHYAVCREAGIVLAGVAPQQVIGPVQRRAILGYLADELGWGLANAPESYAVLNACRAFVYLADGRIVSKVAGGELALDRGFGPAGLLRRALDQQRAMAPERAPGRDAAQFVRRVQRSLAAAACESSPQSG
jgi:streptomycin 3"-adenylyltransferase